MKLTTPQRAIRLIVAALLLIIATSTNTPAASPTYAQSTTITVTTTDDELNNDGDCSLREAVQAANTNSAVDACPAGTIGSDTITLPAGTYTLTMPGQDEDGNATGDLDILDSLVINGQGTDQTILDGGGIDRVLHIAQGVSTEITGITIQHGSTILGGGILNQSTLVISDSLLRENSAEVSGGGIYSAETPAVYLDMLSPQLGSASLTLHNTQVLSNTALSEIGGGMVAAGHLTLRESTVEHNSAMGFGGLAAIDEVLLIGSSISHNGATNGVGGIGAFGNITMIDCVVSHNSASDDILEREEDSRFRGVIGGMAASGIVTLRDSTISHNDADGGVGGLTLYFGTAITMTGMDIRRNISRDGPVGGVLNVGGFVTIEESSITRNKAETPYGGGGIVNLSHMEILNTTISANAAPLGEGGGISNFDSSVLQGEIELPPGSSSLFPDTRLTIIDSTIAENSASLQGGGIVNGTSDSLRSASLTVINSTIRNNSVTDSQPPDGGGGGISNWSTLTIENSTIEGNESARSAGGIYNAAMADTTIQGSRIISNTAEVDGGGLASAGIMTLIDTSVSANKGVSGAGIVNTSQPSSGNKGTLTMHHTTVSGNSADTSCGGIYNHGNLVMADGSMVHNNRANDGIGGGICNGMSTNVGFAELFPSSMVISSSTISSNSTSKSGGGILNQGELKLTTSTIADNEAVRNGGGISNAGSITITASIITSNSADNEGGGGVRNSGAAFIADSTISDNLTSNGTGGGVRNADGVLDLFNVTMSNNQAPVAGGGIFVDAGSLVGIGSSTISHNATTSTESAGAGVFAAGEVHVMNSMVVHNTGAGDCATPGGTVISHGNNIASDRTCIFTDTTDLLDTDPLLSDLQDNGGPTFTRALREGSPAIDAGNNFLCWQWDQRGFARVVDGDGDGEKRCDIGAFEYGSTSSMPVEPLPAEGIIILPAGGDIDIADGYVTIPPDAVETVIKLEYTDLSEPTHPLSEPERAMRSFLLTATDGNGTEVHQFATPITITLTYADADLPEEVDEDTLAVLTWSDGDSAWVTVASSETCPQCGATVNGERNEVTITINHLSEFALVGRVTLPTSNRVYLPLVGR